MKEYTLYELDLPLSEGITSRLKPSEDLGDDYRWYLIVGHRAGIVKQDMGYVRLIKGNRDLAMFKYSDSSVKGVIYVI
jgi:hypothetical protein